MKASLVNGGARATMRAVMRQAGFAAFVAALAVVGARADEAKLPPMPRPLEEMAADRARVAPETASMEAWGRAHPDCAEWTDNCQVCVAGDKPGCSTVGAACTRAAPTCRRIRTVEHPAPAPRPQTPVPQQSAPAPAQIPPAASPPKP